MYSSRLVSALVGALVRLVQDRMQLTSQLNKCLPASRLLLRCPDRGDLPDGCRDLADQWLQPLIVRLRRRHSLPGCGDLVGMLGDVRPSLVGQAVGPLPLRCVRPHEALVLELLQRGVDRPRARLPGATAAFGDLL